MNNKVSLMCKIYISFVRRNVCKGESKPVSPKFMEHHQGACKRSLRKASARLEGQVLCLYLSHAKSESGSFRITENAGTCKCL